MAPNRSNSEAQWLLVLAAAIISFSFVSPAPSLQELKKLREQAKNRLFSTTTSAPVFLSNQLTCEEKFENAEKFIFNETSLHTDIRKLMNTYYDWGALLAPAPIAISVLGKLIVMSSQITDFPIDTNLPTGGYTFIKYPKSFRTTLLQISHQGYLAFLKAHTNMDMIRMSNANVPGYIKDATRYLMSRNEVYIVNLLPISLWYIKEAADKSKELSAEVVKEFKIVVELIQETILAVSDTKNDKEVKLSEVESDIQLSEIARNFSLNETKLLEDKNQMLSGMLNSFEDRQKNIFIRTIYGNENFVINLSQEWHSSQTKGRHERHRDIFYYGTSNWEYSFGEERLEINKCIEQNNQQLLDLIIAMGQYRFKYETWQNSSSKKTEPFNGVEDLVELEKGLNTLIQCSNLDVILTKLTALIKRLQNVKFEMLQKTSARPGAEMMDDLILTIKNVRSESNLKTNKGRSDSSTPTLKKTGRSAKQGFNNANLVENWNKVYQKQFNMLQSVINVTADIMKINNKQMELRRQKTQQVLDKIKSLDITKIGYKEVIQALREGLEELGKLKTDWTKLIAFYSKMSIFITKATEESIALIEIVRVIEKETSTLDDEEIHAHFMEKVEKANEASYLIHEVSDMYVKVSEKYIMDRIASLDSMMNIDATKINLNEFQNKLMNDTESASEGILRFIKADETSLRQDLVDRKNQIMDEYQFMIDCISPEDRQFKTEE